MLDIMALFRAMPGACAQGLVWGIMALGVYITYKLLDFADLTVDSSLATGGAVAVMLIISDVPTPIALLAATAAGGIAGFITGFLHTALGIPDILSGILTQIALYSVNLNILGASNKSVSVDMYSLVISLRYIPKAVITTILFIAALAVILYWFFGTEYGFTIRSTGCNPNMSRAQGVNTNKSKVVALIISNAIVGLSGGLLAQYQGYADVGMGRGAIVIGLAAVIIGQVLGESILGNRMNFIAKMLFVVLGAMIYYIVITFVLWLGLPSEDMKLFSALVVAIFLAVPYLRGKARSSFRKGGSR